MKKIFISILLIIQCSSPVFAAGIPVIDGAALSQTVLQWTERLQQWQETVTHYKKQMDAYGHELAAKTGVKDITGFMGQVKGLYSEMQKTYGQAQDIYNLTNSLANTPMSENLLNMYDRYGDFAGCNKHTDKMVVDICKKEAIATVVQIEETRKTQEKMNTILKDIDKLAARVENSKDIKESQDLANAISLRSLQLNTLTKNWEMQMRQAEAQEKVLQKEKEKMFRERQMNAKGLDFSDFKVKR